MDDDIKKSPIECSECGEELGEEDTIFECEDCEEVFCETCEDKHTCIDMSSEENTPCADCGDIDEEMYSCEKCGDWFCENCKEEHAKEEIKMNNYDYENYVKQKVIDGVKDDG